MKKIFLIALFLIVLCGCQKIPYRLEEKYYSKSEIIEINNTEIKQLEEDKESFIVFVHLTDCLSCQDFNNVLDKFLENNNLVIYKLNYNEIKGSEIEENIKYAPSLVLYSKGKIVKYLDANKDEDLIYYQDSKELKSWLEEYVEIK